MRLTDASLPPADGELWSLVETFVEGGATPDECRRLEDRLRGEPAARMFYVAYLDLHAQLQWRTRGETGGVAENANVALVGPAREIRRPLVWSSLAAIGSVAAAIAVMVPAGALFLRRRPQREKHHLPAARAMACDKTSTANPTPPTL